jgi:HK97 family phage portal protein
VSVPRKLHGALTGKAAGGATLGIPGSRGGSPFRSDSAGTMQNAGAAKHSEVYGGGRNGVDYFYEAANIFATAASSADWHLRSEDGTRAVLELPDGEKPDNVERLSGDLRTLFTLPNPWMTWRELIELYVIDLLAVGDAFWLKQGAMQDGSRPLALYRVSPQYVEIQKGENQLIKKYIFGQGREAMKVDPQFVVHTRLPNPHSENAMLGLGVVQAAPQVFDVELGLLEAERAFFDNGTVLGGTLESDKTIPEATRKKNLREFKQMNRGVRQWFNVVHLERGLRYRPIQANAQQADFKNLSQQSRERIFGLLRTPIILSGVATGEAAGMKMDEARRFWSEEVGGPFLGRLAESFSQSLVQGWGYSFKFDFGYKMPEADKIELALDYADLPGITVGEVRAKAGLPPLPADMVNPMTGESINDFVLNLPGPSTEGPDGTPDNLGREGGRPPLRENVAGIPASSNAGDRQVARDDEGPATTRARRGRAGTTALQPVRRRAKAMLFTPEELADGRVSKMIDGYAR